MSILRELANCRPSQQGQGFPRICPHCHSEYALGITGVDSGCDECEGIIRLSNGMIDYEAMNSEALIRKMEEE